MEINEALATQVRQLRKARQMTQEDLAHGSGLSVDYIGKIERATTSPTAESLAHVARGLGVDIGSLFHLYQEGGPSGGPSTELADLCRYLRERSPDDVRFSLEIIRQILER